MGVVSSWTRWRKGCEVQNSWLNLEPYGFRRTQIEGQWMGMSQPRLVCPAPSIVRDRTTLSAVPQDPRFADLPPALLLPCRWVRFALSPPAAARRCPQSLAWPGTPATFT
jgi:hypothetical protein